MRARIAKYDPHGIELEAAGFNIPLVGIPDYRVILLEVAFLKCTNQLYLSEHAIEYRYILTIKHYSYAVSPDGRITRIS